MNEYLSVAWALIQLQASKYREKATKNEREKSQYLDKENDECFQSGWLICYLFIFFSEGHAKLSKSISFTNLNKSFFNKAPFSFHLNRHHICQQVQWWNIVAFVRALYAQKLVFVFDQTGLIVETQEGKQNSELRKDLGPSTHLYGIVRSQKAANWQPRRCLLKRTEFSVE